MRFYLCESLRLCVSTDLGIGYYIGAAAKVDWVWSWRSRALILRLPNLASFVGVCCSSFYVCCFERGSYRWLKLALVWASGLSPSYWCISCMILELEQCERWDRWSPYVRWVIVTIPMLLELSSFETTEEASSILILLEHILSYFRRSVTYGLTIWLFWFRYCILFGGGSRVELVIILYSVVGNCS